MGIGTPITMRVFVEPLETELALQILVHSDDISKQELEDSLARAIKNFLIFRFRPATAPQVQVEIE